MGNHVQDGDFGLDGVERDAFVFDEELGRTGRVGGNRVDFQRGFGR